MKKHQHTSTKNIKISILCFFDTFNVRKKENMLDKTDKTILKLLQNNGKQTINSLAKELNLTTSPVFERIKRLEKCGIITGYTALINHKKVGKSQVVLCNVSMPDYSPDSIKQFEDKITQMPEVLECFHIAGKVDYQMKVLVKDIDAYHAFLQNFAKLPWVKIDSSVVVLKQVKSTTVIDL